MTYVEHYFESLLYDGRDIPGDLNKIRLTLEEQCAIEQCAYYVLYSLFDNREAFLKAFRFTEEGDAE